MRLKHLAFVRALESQGIPKDQMPLTRPLCGELLVAYAVESADQFTFATPSMMEQAEVAPPDARPLALQNLQRKILTHGLRLVEDGGPHMLRIGQEGTETHLEAACLLIDGIWDMLVEKTECRGELLLLTPTRDFLLALDSAKPESHANAMAFAKHVAVLDKTHALSAQLMVRRPGGIAVWQQD